jgi:hypothetical protein
MVCGTSKLHFSNVLRDAVLKNDLTAGTATALEILQCTREGRANGHRINNTASRFQ